MNKKSKFVDAAQKHLQKGAYDKAIKELQKLLEEDPRDVRTLLKIGDIYAKKGDGAEATKTYRQVAEAYSEQGFFLKAVAVYKQILKHEPQNLEVALKLAELYEHLGVMQEAMVQYQIVAGILDARGSTREWLGVLQRMVELEPDNVASHVRYAEGLSREQRADESIAQFIVACELLEKQGRTDDWAKVAERLVFLAPARYDVLKRLAKHYLATGDLRRAIARLEPCFRGLPADVETLTLLGRAFREAEHTNKAVYIYKELARVHQEEGRPAEARRTQQMILELDPSDADAAAALGTAPTPSKRPSQVAPPRPASSADHEGAAPRARAAGPRVPSAARPAARAPSSAQVRSGPRVPSAARPPPPSGSARPSISKVSKETAKLLSETDVYVKYGLREKALEHLRRIVGIDADALEAYAKMRDLYMAGGDRPRAADALASMVRIHKRRGEDEVAEQVRAELAALVPGHPLARPGDHDLDYATADDVGEEPDPDLDSIDIDVNEESGELPVVEHLRGALSRSTFALGAPPVAPQDTSDLSLEDPASSAESLGEFDILDIHPRGESGLHARDDRGAADIPVVRGEALPDDDSGGFGRIGTDLDGQLAGTPTFDPQVDADSLFEGERIPVVSEDLPLSADSITGAIAVVSRDEPLERASQLPAAAETSPAPGDAELLSLLEGGDDLGPTPSEDAAFDPALDEDFENVEFLLGQQLHDDAREAVLEILKRHPLHPRAIAALDLAEVALGMRPSGPRYTIEPIPDVPGARAAEHEPMPMPIRPSDTDQTALDELMGAADFGLVDPAEASDPVTVRPESVNGDLHRAAFGDDDADAIAIADAELTRGYELQQQGLLGEAIAAYDAATRVPSRAAQAYEMLGICLQSQGDTMGAVTAFYRALEPGAPPARAPRLKYEIGIACETASDLENALAWYLAAYADDPTQPHLRARIENLGADPDQALVSSTPLAQAAPVARDPELPPAAPATPPAARRRNKISYI